MQPQHEAPARSDGIPVSRSSPSWPFTIGIPLLLIARFFQTVTLAPGSYAVLLLLALGLTAVADALFIYAFCRGGVVARFLSMLCLPPTFFFFVDFLRRAPHLLTR